MKEKQGEDSEERGKDGEEKGKGREGSQIFP